MSLGEQDPDMRIVLTDPLAAKFEALTGLPVDQFLSQFTTLDPRVSHGASLEVRPVGMFQNLYSSGRGLDVLAGRRRYIFSPTSPESQQAYELLRRNGVPVVPQKAVFDNRFALAMVPPDTRPLSQIPLLDRKPTSQTEIGAIEIFRETGRLLGTIYRISMGQLPIELSLDDIAFIPRQPANFIRLIPPFVLADAEIDRVMGLISGRSSGREQQEALIDSFTQAQRKS